MNISSAVFVQSNSDYKLCPPADRPEYVFIGRSNVGKSSLINLLTSKPGLAKTSQIPGKTRLINHFLINQEWYIVDLPGYGWAKVSKTEREKWDATLRQYLKKRENIMCVFVLLDSRLEPQAVDLEFMQWLSENSVPFAMVFTKIDKHSNTKNESNLAHYEAVMLEQWEELPLYFITSAVLKEGKEALLNYIEELNSLFIVTPPSLSAKKNPGNLS
ncbi:MAG: ribosome biogenesis GTP-binding protein YihA/YsxC [Bacteroidota bacterium]